MKKEVFLQVRICEIYRMKNKWLIGGMVLVITACGGAVKQQDEMKETAVEVVTDAVGDEETMFQDTLILVEDVIPESADESFADFFYNFLVEEAFQRSRIAFPMSCYHQDEIKHISKDEWVFDPMFSHDESYTVLFDKEEDMALEKVSGTVSVQVDNIFITDKHIKRYFFEKKNEQWLLEAVSHEVLNDAPGEDFYEFYARFVSDSVFQCQRIELPLSFITTDPDDDFNTLETSIDQTQWLAFRPPMTKDKLTNIHYGQELLLTSDTRVVEYKGLANGSSSVLYFERRGGQWKLVKFDDLSD